MDHMVVDILVDRVSYYLLMIGGDLIGMVERRVVMRVNILVASLMDMMLMDKEWMVVLLVGVDKVKILVVMSCSMVDMMGYMVDCNLVGVV